MNDRKRSSRHAVPQQSLLHPVTSIVFAKRGAVLVQEIDRSFNRACVTFRRFYNRRDYTSVPSNDKMVRNDNCKRCI